MKKITFYKSGICPRCMFVDRVLTDIASTHPDIEIEKIDILANPVKTWQEGVKMIPALKSGNRILSGIFLTRKEIKDFLSGEWLK